jgi:hypothetical protein
VKSLFTRKIRKECEVASTLKENIGFIDQIKNNTTKATQTAIPYNDIADR